VLARELGKWVGEFRRASNEFKMQMEDELRQVEQAERLKKIEAMEAAAPVAPALPETTAETSEPVDSPVATEAAESVAGFSSDEPAAEAEVKPLPIAESGEVTMMPPSTGLPTPRNGSVGGLLRAIPAAPAETNGTHPPMDSAEPAETRANAD
jgi:sec-independent protein translocase protein TatB